MAYSRPVQFFWFAGATVLIIALFHFMGGGSSTDWISKIKTFPFAKTKDNGRVSLREHVDLAERNWAKTVRQRHEMRKDWADQQNIPSFPAHDVPSHFKTPYSIRDFIPASYSCPYEMERIGRMGDGGKWVCGMSLYEAIPAEKPCIIYSFGVQFESSFEDEMLSRTHCEIWAYDFSVVDFGKQLNASHRDRAHFKQAGIAGDTDVSHDPPVYSIQDLMKMNGHDYLDILKIGIEFAESRSLSSLSKAFPKAAGMDFPIGQVMIELHLFAAQGISSGQFLTWWESFEDRGLRPTWAEPNLLDKDKKPRLGYTLINTHDARSVLFKSLNQQ